MIEMKIKDLTQNLENYPEIKTLIKNEPGIYDKIRDEFKFKTMTEAEKSLLASNDTEKSFVELPTGYLNGIISAIYTRQDDIKRWLSSSQKRFVLNPRNRYYDEIFLESLDRVGYNLKKVSSNIKPEIETRELVGLEIVLEKDEENIYIKDVFPNNNMLRDFVLPDDQTKVKTKEQIQSEDKITQEEANQMLMEITQKALEPFKDDIEELEPEDELSK